MAGRAPKLRRAAVRPASLRFAIVASRFNERITQRLVSGAREAFQSAGLGKDAVELHWVPGSFELPLAANHLARTGGFAGIVCVGVVIRGQTPHFEHVAREAASGIRQVALATGIPTTFGLITARRYRIEFPAGEELNLEMQATKSAERFFNRIADLVSSTTG